jgi:hypothetical protein
MDKFEAQAELISDNDDSQSIGHAIFNISVLAKDQQLMPTIPDIEKHFTGSETVRDIVIGMADGLTVPFALAAGLSAAVSSTKIIATAGMAEIAAGAIAMINATSEEPANRVVWHITATLRARFNLAPRHSYRNASIGSRRAALRAG